jgi:uncharacterized damage-inducible protein DinB
MSSGQSRFGYPEGDPTRKKARPLMTVKDLERLFDYSYWANQKLFAVMVQLTPEQFTQPLADNHGSIRNTTVHILSAEWGWLDRCGGRARGAALDPNNFQTVATLIESWHQVEGHVRTLLSALRDEDLSRIVEFVIGGTEKRALPLGQLLQHAANHGVHHRGQVSLLLRLRGYAPDNFDIILYDFEKHPSVVP